MAIGTFTNKVFSFRDPFAFIKSRGSQNKNIQLSTNIAATGNYTTPSGSQNVSAGDLMRAQLLNTFDRRTEKGAWTGSRLTASGRCVECTISAAKHLQGELGVEQMGHTIDSITDQRATNKVKGSHISQIQKLFNRGILKVGDALSFTTQGNVNMDQGILADAGQRLNNHAAMLTILTDKNGQPIMENGEYKVGLIDNARGNGLEKKKIISLKEFEQFVGGYSPYIYAVGRPDYGTSNTIATA